MSDPEFDRALAIVLSKISDDPTLLNQLPHDILRKLIIHVGMLDINQIVEINSNAYKLKSIIDALNRPCATSRNLVEFSKCSKCDYVEACVEDDNIVEFSKCSHCDYVEAWTESRERIHHCSCGDCNNLVCNGCISFNGYCPLCEVYGDEDCLYCIEKEREMDAAN
jgi:hypothetical protein